ncbi:MAG: ATP synthase subunit I [Nitrospinae bacterium CG11_big_fil_rev_8_21_14_0_20_56_8]|nr:MAG: ATP synthase subunit I [Nitrospinae bacterium CG11_big_fil_rev_8_21_14_0_20_56_8]
MNEGSGFRQGLSIAFRLGIELTVATLVGAGMGYGLDHLLGTRPWFLVLGVFLGATAGALNVYRIAQDFQVEDEGGEKKDRSDPEDPSGKSD